MGVRVGRQLHVHITSSREAVLKLKIGLHRFLLHFYLLQAAFPFYTCNITELEIHYSH